MSRDYSKGKIYKVVCNKSGKQYIGSTIQELPSRLSVHRSDFKRFVLGKSKYRCYSFFVIEQGNYDIVLIEDYPCEKEIQLKTREREYIESSECVNKNIPNRSWKEWRDANKDYWKNYYQQNKDKKKEYYQQNRDKRIEYQKKYRLRKKHEKIDMILYKKRI